MNRAQHATLLAIVTGVSVSVSATPGFLRGIGWSPWHAVYGWGRPPEVVAQDYAILKDLHVNALRTWGPASRKTCDELRKRGLFIVPQIGRGKVPRLHFKDGKAGQPDYLAPAARADIRTHARELAKALAGHPAVAAYNLGNEYSWVGQNKSKKYQSLGFDPGVQKAFHDTLEARFGSIEKWNRLTGRKDPSFNTITPPTGSAPYLLYWEWWRFQRRAFSDFMRSGYVGIREADPRTPVTYALLCGGRWDAATEDADLAFLEQQGDNLYYHWDKNWGRYCVRLARRIGPGRPILITESGINTWTFRDPAVASRLMKQMLWLLAMHPEVRGVFPFVYCDEWWHGPDPKALDVAGDAWGIVTADRKPKSTYAPLRDTYAEFEKLDSFMATRQAPVEVLVTDQAIDRWRGKAGPAVDDVCRALYRHGVSFRLVSLLRPSDVNSALCKRLVLLDSTIPDSPDGKSPAWDALKAFGTGGGRMLYLCERPWRGLYRAGGAPAGVRAKIVQCADRDVWPALEAFLGKRRITVEAAGGEEVFWRQVTGAGQSMLLIVVTGPKSIGRITVRGAHVAALVSADGARIKPEPDGTCRLQGFNTYALLRLTPGATDNVRR